MYVYVDINSFQFRKKTVNDNSSCENGHIFVNPSFNLFAECKKAVQANGK